jgi:4-hydroxy-2-oxoheptanedioate aldolase
MGVEFGGKEHEAAIAHILDAAHAARKTAAIFCARTSVFLLIVQHVLIVNLVRTGLDGAQAASRYKQGFDMVSIATDIDTLVAGFADHAAQAGAGEAKVKSGYST